MNNIEVEIKVKIDDFTRIKNVLKGVGADFVKTEKQMDKIFGASKFLDSENMMIEGGIVARIREIDGKKTLEFKEILRQKGGLELSCEISSIELAQRLLGKLDFKEAFAIKKTRELYSYKDFTICLDAVEELGDFMEIEKMVISPEMVEETKKEILDLLNDLAPGAEVETRKYGDLMQELINQKRKPV